MHLDFCLMYLVALCTKSTLYVCIHSLGVPDLPNATSKAASGFQAAVRGITPVGRQLQSSTWFVDQPLTVCPTTLNTQPLVKAQIVEQTQNFETPAGKCLALLPWTAKALSEDTTW